MDRQHTYTNHPTNIGNTNRRFKFNQNHNSPSSNLNYQPSTTYSINFSLPASENIIHRPYLPGLKKTKTTTTTTQESQLKKDLYNSSLNKYKLLEKELDKRKKEQLKLNRQSTIDTKKQHSQSYSNIFSNKSPQFVNRDKNSQLAKPNLIRSNATTNYEQTNSLNDLYKVENLFNCDLDKKEDNDDKSKSIEFMRLDNKIDNKLVDKSCNTSFDTSLDDKLNNNYIDKIDQIIDKLDNQLDNKKDNQINKHHKINDNLDLKPKIILTQPSIDLDKSTIEQEQLFKSSLSNRLNVYSIKRKQNLQESEKKIANQNWFSWFKIILQFNDNDSDQKTIKEMFFNLIKKWYRELVLITILLICIFNAIRTSQLNTRKTRLPTKFLPDNQLIKEYEFGDLQELSQLAFQNEITFVMYYAPWNSECIEFKNEYLKISKYYKDQIFFAAVNCWYPNGECSKSYRIKKFPVFIAHIRNIGEVEYKGPSVANYLIPFLENLLNPVKSIVNEADLLDLKSKHDGVAVGYFDFNESTNPTNYKHFLLASVRSLFQDPFRKIQFAIVSNKKTAIKLEIENTESVYFYTWNSTYQYKNKLKKVDNFLKWIYNTLEEDSPLIEWITPTAFKSDTLSVKLLSEPTLILFTPRSLILNISPYYDILREVAMDYYNCDNSPQIKSLIHRIILRRRLKEEKLFELEEKCHEINTQSNLNADEYKKLNLPKDFKKDDICCHHQLMNWKLDGKTFDKKCYCTACININKKLCPSNCKKFNCLATASRYLTSFDPTQFNNSISYCNDIKSTYHPKYTPYYNIEMSCSGLKQTTNGDDDEYEFKLSNSKTQFDNKEQQKTLINYVDESMERMMNHFEEHHCRKLNLGLNYNDFNFPTGESSSSSQKWRHNFTGLGCRTNKTLGFIAIDSLMYQSYLEGLGISSVDEIHNTVIMIVEAEEENIYVLNHISKKDNNEVTTINKKMIYEFIKDYNDSKLRRYLRSPLDKKISSSESCLNKTDEQGRSVICVPEITKNTFNEIVLDDKKDVLLLFYTQWCGFCNQIASIFLTVAKFFTNIDGIVFARINADLNDLPFEYTVNRYPTLILFPAGKKIDSVVFPHNMPITATSLLQFVLANVQDRVKYQASFQLCNKQCLKRNLLEHHLESKELSLEKLRLINKINELKNSLINNSKNKNLKKIFNDFLLTYGKMIRGKESKYQLFNNLKEILSNRILNFNEGLTEDLNNQLINDMINLLNSPAPSQTQETKLDKNNKAKNEKTLKSNKKSKSKKSINKKDEL